MASFTADPLLFASCIREQSYINTDLLIMGTYLRSALRHKHETLSCQEIKICNVVADYAQTLYAQMRPVGHFVTRGV